MNRWFIRTIGRWDLCNALMRYKDESENNISHFALSTPLLEMAGWMRLNEMAKKFRVQIPRKITRAISLAI
jgi:hypothetical protein